MTHLTDELLDQISKKAAEFFAVIADDLYAINRLDMVHKIMDGDAYLSLTINSKSYAIECRFTPINPRDGSYEILFQNSHRPPVDFRS